MHLRLSFQWPHLRLSFQWPRLRLSFQWKQLTSLFQRPLLMPSFQQLHLMQLFGGPLLMSSFKQLPTWPLFQQPHLTSLFRHRNSCCCSSSRISSHCSVGHFLHPHSSDGVFLFSGRKCKKWLQLVVSYHHKKCKNTHSPRE